MIPDSIAALVSFLLLLAPGIVWQLQAARYRPSVKETSLVEASRVVLASLVATGAAAALLGWVWLPLYRALPGDGTPDTPASLLPYVGASVATSMLACGLTLLTAAIRWPGRAPISPGGVWTKVFVELRPDDTADPYLTVELLDGTVWRGTLSTFDSDPEDDQRSLAISSPLKRRRSGADRFERVDGWRVVVLPESQITSIQVQYPAMSAHQSR